MAHIAMLAIVFAFLLWGVTGFSLVGLIYFPFYASALTVALSLLLLAKRSKRGSSP